jgi:F0F1-type ATP synthase epsilon subunit
MTCSIISPTETKLFTELARISVPGENGTFEIRPGHAELVATVKTGTVHLHHQDDTTTEEPVTDAICWVHNDSIRIIL